MIAAAEIAARRFKVLALCDDVDTCEFCGRTDLQRVVAFEDVESGEVLYAGTSCAETVKLLVLDDEEARGEARPMKAREILTRAARATREAAAATALEGLTWRIVELVIAANETYAAGSPAYPARLSNPFGRSDFGYGVLVPQLGPCHGFVWELFRSYIKARDLKGSLAKRERHTAEIGAEVEARRVRWAVALSAGAPVAS